MALSEIQRNILNRVVERFVNLRSSTDRNALVREFEDPDPIDQLQQWQLLKTPDITNYLPTALSFHYCGDAEVEAYAKRGIEVLAEVFRNMYLRDKVDFTPEGLREAAAKIDKHADERMIRLGLYLAPDFRLLSGWAGGVPQQPDITPTGINEAIVKLKRFDTIWDDYIRQRVPWPVQDSMGGIVPRHPMFTAYDDEEELMKYESSANQGILVLISHSSRDAKLAEALVDLLRSGIGLLPAHIRCSSVDGYRLPAGAHAETQLRQEVNATRVLIGLITPSSLASPYVLFELGARWGGGNPMIPVLAGVMANELRGPLSGLNALLCSEEAQLHQLLRDVGSQLNLAVQGADSYLKHVKALKAMSESMSSAGALQPSTQEEMVFEESVYWKHKNGEREGPYCPVCYDGKHTAIHLNPGATKGTYGCGACRNSFRTDEYDARPSRRRPYSSR